METLTSSTGLSATQRRRRRRKLAGGQERRKKARKLAGGRAVASDSNSEPLVTNPQLEDDPNQMGIGSSDGRAAIGAGDVLHPSVYLAVNRGNWLSSEGFYFPLHKVEVASDDDGSSSRGEAPLASHVTNIETGAGFKTIVSVKSRWIVSVGGNPSRTVIFDTKTAEVITGPDLVAAKSSPVVMAVEYRLYALSATARFEEGPDFTPWFEVLDLSKAMDAEGNLGLLDLCSWEAMPSPPFFARELPKAVDLPPPKSVGDILPPIITVGSYVVVGQYLAEEWHKVDDTCLPFYGAATQLGHSGRVFLGLSRKNGSVSAYRICASPSSGRSAMAGLPAKDGALKLSITVFSLKTKAHERISIGDGHYFTSLDGTCFSTLFDSLDGRICHRKYSKITREFYSTMLGARLRTYQIESESLELLEATDEEKLLAVEPEITVSIQREHDFRIFSAHGFNRTPIAFVASI
nr:unnamed protein product [Digitaria exilis]